MNASRKLHTPNKIANSMLFCSKLRKIREISKFFNKNHILNDCYIGKLKKKLLQQKYKCGSTYKEGERL